jgi:hypothetical protein
VDRSACRARDDVGVGPRECVAVQTERAALGGIGIDRYGTLPLDPGHDDWGRLAVLDRDRADAPLRPKPV